MISNTFQILKVVSYTDIPDSFPAHVCYFTSNTGKYYIYRNSIHEEVFIGGAPFIGLIDILHADLVITKTAGELIPGMKYRITDFQTIYDQPDFSSKYSAKQTAELKTTNIDPIIVTAISESELELNAFQESYPNDKIKYILEYTTLFSDTPTKGRIIERIDEWNNRTDFDHRKVLFKRYAAILPIQQYSDSLLYGNYWDSSQDYPEREYDIITNTPVLSNTVYPTTYRSYVCTTAGTRDFGAGNVTVNVGDFIYFNNDSEWVQFDGCKEFPMFDTTGLWKPLSNYIEGNYQASLSQNDINGDINSVFDLPNIVFMDTSVCENNFLGACTNATFFGETLYNIFNGIISGVRIGWSNGMCIGNSLTYRLINVNVSEQFNNNSIHGMTEVDVIGRINGNKFNHVFSITGRAEIFTNIFNEVSQISSSFDYGSLLRIQGNNIIDFRQIQFDNSGSYISIHESSINSFRNCQFLSSSSGILNCDFKYFVGNEMHQNSITYCKGLVVSGNTFYGAISNSDFGPRFIDNIVGPGFGKDTNSQNFPTGFDGEVVQLAESNVFKCEVSECTFGSNVTGNTFDYILTNTIIPDFFQRNYIKGLGDSMYLTLNDLSGIPELTSPTITTIGTRKVKITQQILDDNSIDIIFQDLDENGDDRYWIKGFSFQINVDRQFMTNSTTFVGATDTGLGTGYKNSIKIAKADNYSKIGAISQIYYYGYELNNNCIPSLDELQLMYTNRIQLGLPSIGIHWSSSEIDATTAYAVDFSDGNTVSLPKTEAHSVVHIKYVSHFDSVVIKYTDEYGSKIVKSLF